MEILGKKVPLAEIYSMINLTVVYAAFLLLFTYITAIITPYLSGNAIIINAIRLFTSPFNSYFEGNYQSNIGLTLVILFITEIYLKSRHRKLLISEVLASSILATYAVSFVDLLFIHIPGAGSSIVSISVFVFVLLFFISDVMNFAVQTRKRIRSYSNQITRRKRIIGYFLLILLVILMIPLAFEGVKLYYSLYIQELGFTPLNPHILGLIAFFIILILEDFKFDLLK